MNGWERLEHLIEAKRYGELWTRVEEFSKLISFPLDDFQVALIVLAVKRNSVLHISAMRKIGKTHLLGFLCLFLGFLGYDGVYCNHKRQFVEEFFDFVEGYAIRLLDAGLIRKIDGGADKKIIFADGNKVSFSTRSASFGRGYMKLDFVLWDEAQKSSSAQRKEISGALYLSKLKLQIYVGNPATVKDTLAWPDSPFTMAKKAKSPTMIEFSGALEYSPDLKLTADLLLACNPNAHRLGDHAALEKLIEDEFEQGKSHEEVASELFGIWNLPEDVDKIEPEFSGAQIHRILSHPKQKSVAERFHLSVAMSFKAEYAYMVINDGVTMEVARKIELPMGSVERVAQWILANRVRFERVHVMGTAKGKALIDLLRPIGKFVNEVKPNAFATNMARFVQQVDGGSLRVVETAEVRQALASFWIAHDPKTHAAVVKAITEEDISLVMSLMMAAIDDGVLNRIMLSNGRLPAKKEEPEEVDEPMAPAKLSSNRPQPKKVDPMRDRAERLAAERAAREKEMADG